MGRPVSKKPASATTRPRPQPPPPTREAPPCGETTPDVVGPASDQCYKYLLKDKKITGLGCTGHISGAGSSCVNLSGAFAVPGSALFVLCCKKEEGKCVDCSGTVTLEVWDAGNTIIAQVDTTVVCKPLP